MYKITGEDEFLGYAKRTARFIISQSFVSDEPGDIYERKAPILSEDIKRETGMETGGERYRRMSTAIPVYTLEQQEMHGVCYL